MEQFRILATDHGPHPSERWAMHTAEEVFNTSKIADPARTVQARAVQIKIAEALSAHYDAAQKGERGRLAANADAHLMTEHDGAPAEAMATMLSAVKGTPWEAHYAKAEVQAEVMRTLQHHFVTAQHIERLWWCDRNMDRIGVANDMIHNYRLRFQGA